MVVTKIATVTKKLSNQPMATKTVTINRRR